MSGGGGGSGNDGSNDMQVSGYEAAMSTEKGITCPTSETYGLRGLSGASLGKPDQETGNWDSLL